MTNALLNAGVARARGELVALDLRGCERVTFDALLAVVTANGALRELRTRGFPARFGVCEPLNARALEYLLEAAPRLVVCDADVACHDLSLARRLLHNEPPFTPLRVHTFQYDGGDAGLDEADVVELAADLASHAHLQRLYIECVCLNTAAVLDAVVDAALTRRLTSVTLHACDLSPESASALVRLIGGGALAELDVCFNDVCFNDLLFFNGGHQLLDVPAALALGDALRASGTLTAVSLRCVGLWRVPAAATALLGALTGHPSLRSLSAYGNEMEREHQEEAGAALGALVAANAPALVSLDVSECDLGCAGLGPLFDALPANTHLTKLDCSFNKLTGVFVRERLLPAVRANASLRELDAGGSAQKSAAAAENLVRRRADAE